jgi:hypothetical protein
MDFARSMQQLVTHPGTAPGELEIIVGNLLDLAKSPSQSDTPATGTSDGPAEER